MTTAPDIDRLFNLLPAIYRQRDADEQGQLKALLRVIAEQVNIVEADIAQLYENWFIETCQDWVVPYIGDLVGYASVFETGEAAASTTPEGKMLDKITITRSGVANTIHDRRRKGTLSILEQLARDVADWPAHAVEFFKYVAVTQNINMPHQQRGRTVDIRDNAELDHIGGPFTRAAHTADVRRIVSQHKRGRYDLPNVGLFIWRLKAYTVTKAPAYCFEEVSPSCYTFSVLGNDSQLFRQPQPNHYPVNEINFAGPLSRHSLRKHLSEYYGEGKSFAIWKIDAPERLSPPEGAKTTPAAQRKRRGRRREEPSASNLAQTQQASQAESSEDLTLVPADQIVVANLSEWRYHPRPDQVAVDPVRGRIMFPPGHPPEEVIVSYCYGFSTDMGGGEYHRPLLQPSQFTTSQVFRVGKYLDTTQTNNFTTIRDALKKWDAMRDSIRKEKDNTKDSTGDSTLSLNAIIEIVDSGVYTEQIHIQLEEDEYLTIRAADRQRPVIRLIDWQENRPDSLRVRGEAGSRFTLDGLLVTGRPVQITGTLTGVHLRHCTLVPGWGLNNDCEPRRPAEPSLELFQSGECVTIEHSILGAILVYENAAQNDPLRITISDSIVDATNTERNALSQPVDDIAYADVRILRCTVFGQVRVHALQLAENSIFTGEIHVARRQLGCMRFCSIVPGSRTPRRYHCQPDLVKQAAEKVAQSMTDAQAEAALIQLELDRVRPHFNSTRYGTATYCQLARDCAVEIKSGADDQSEMGVFHDLFQPQRETNLRTRLDEYTPAGMETGIIYIN